MDEPGFGTDFLTTAITRKPVLSALAEGPRRRRELREELGFSKSTCHRVVRSFEENGLVERSDGAYALTELGHAVETRVEEFTEGVRTAVRLEPLLEAFGETDVSFDPDLFAEATVTRPTPEDPTPPVDRHLELFEGCGRIRTLDRTSFTPPLYVEKMFELAIENGAEGVLLLPEAIVEKRLTTHPEVHRKLGDEGSRIRYRVVDEVPFGLTIYDDESVGLRVYDDETGALVLFADTADPGAVSWAEGVFERYRERSRPASAVEGLPDPGAGADRRD